MALSACGLFRSAQQDDTGLAEVEAPQGPTVPYAVTFGGPISDELRAALESASVAAHQTERPPASAFLLQRRAENDLANLEKALHSEGYYDGSVTVRISDAPPRDDLFHLPTAGPAPEKEVAFTVEPGQLYRFHALVVEVLEPKGGFEAPAAAELGLKPGDPARAAAVLDAQNTLVRRAEESGHPLAEAGELGAVIDRDSKTMDVTLRVRPGPEADFGEVRFTGDTGIKHRFLLRQVPIRPGQRFDPVRLEDGRQNLIETGLFSSVIIERPNELAPDGTLPVTYALTQRKHRSIGAGIGYRTDEGPNANVFWEHRNLFSAGEQLRLSLYGSPVRQEASAYFLKPDVFARRRNFVAQAALRREDTDAYESESIGASVALQQIFRPGLRGSLGVAYRFANVQEKGEESDFVGLFSIPATLDWDYSDSLLDPTRGGRVAVSAAPFIDTLDPSVYFFKSQVTATRYVPVLASPRVVLAFRGSAGSLAGADRDEVPADERFYSGGGGSVRGFGYQLAGPVNDDHDPIGGTSLLEVNGEVRVRVTQNIGFVTFVDAGTVFDAPVPDFSEEMRVGAGVGLRYSTPIGPVRLDVGIPLNPRDDVDDPYQIYVSLGQAF